MSILYASQAGIAEHKAKGDQLHYLMAGGKYLHQEGKHLQDGRLYAWTGTITQAQNCRRDHPAAVGCKAIPCTSITPTALNEEAV